MSSLVPTPRTDKNGRIVTRHVRAEQPVKTATAMPAIPAAQTKSTAELEDRRELHRFLLEHFDIEAIDPRYASEWLTATENLDRDDPATLTLARELMTTGPAKAREYAAREAKWIIDSVIDADDYSATRDGWREYAPRVLSPRGKNMLAAAWCMGAVHESVGAQRTEDAWMSSLIQVLRVHGRFAPEPDSDASDRRAWWRGLAAAEHAHVVVAFRDRADTPEEVRELRDLVGRLGTSGSIGAIATELRSRGYLPVADALVVVKGLDGVPAPLASGAL